MTLGPIPAPPGDSVNARADLPGFVGIADRKSDTAIPGPVRAKDVYQIFETSVSDLAAALGECGPRTFSDDAVRELAIQQAKFLNEIGLGAINLARRNQVDIVSAVDIRTAEASLRAKRPSLLSRILETIGVLLTGAGLTQLYSVLSASKTSPTSKLAHLVALVSLVIGSGLLSIGLARARDRRPPG